MSDVFFVVLRHGQVPFASGNDDLVFYLGIIVGLVVVASVGVFATNRVVQRRRYNSHAALFSGLCRAHGLNRKARALLKQVAQHHRLARPALLFVEPKWLHPKALGSRFESQQTELTALAKQLFQKKKKKAD